MKARNTQWQTRLEPMSDGSDLIRRMPADALATLSRPGMVVLADGSDIGVIDSMTSDFAVVRFESGKVEAYRWGEITLIHVRPDPAHLAPSPRRRLARKPRRALARRRA